MEAVKAIDCKSVATLIVLRLFILAGCRLLVWYNSRGKEKCRKSVYESFPGKDELLCKEYPYSGTERKIAGYDLLVMTPAPSG